MYIPAARNKLELVCWLMPTNSLNPCSNSVSYLSPLFCGNDWNYLSKFTQLIGSSNRFSIKSDSGGCILSVPPWHCSGIFSNSFLITRRKRHRTWIFSGRMNELVHSYLGLNFLVLPPVLLQNHRSQSSSLSFPDPVLQTTSSRPRPPDLCMEFPFFAPFWSSRRGRFHPPGLT